MAQLHLLPLSDAWLDHLDSVARRALGVSDLRGGRLAQAVTQVSHMYTRDRARMSELIGDDDALCARLKFYLSRDLLKVHGPVAELASVAAFPRRARLRVLDLGAGLGATCLGLARSVTQLGLASALEVVAVDVDAEALELMGAICRDLTSLPGAPIELTTRESDLAGALPLSASERFDVICIGLALNELVAASAVADRAERHAERLTQLSRYLREDGVLIAIEPALRETSRALHAARDRIANQPGPPYVFAPCLGPATCPMLERERDYCHERVPCELPERLATLAREAGLRDADLTYSYLTLHRAERTLSELAPRAGAASLFRAVSAGLDSKGKRELWLCGRAGAPRAMRLDRHASQDNDPFAYAERGAILELAPIDLAPGAARVRIVKDTRVELRQAWRTEEAPGQTEVADS